MRYCIQAVADAFGERARNAAADWTQVTESLGAARDTVIACDGLGEAVATAPNNDEPTATYLHLQAGQRRGSGCPPRHPPRWTQPWPATCPSSVSRDRTGDHTDSRPTARPAADMYRAQPARRPAPGGRGLVLPTSIEDPTGCALTSAVAVVS